MKCKELLNNLYFYITGEIDENIKSEIKNHIENCAECRETVSAFSKTLNLIDNNKTAVPAKNWNYFNEKLFDRIYASKPYRLLKPAVVAFSLLLFIFVFEYRQFNTVQPSTAMTSYEAEELAYLTDFDIPELQQ